MESLPVNVREKLIFQTQRMPHTTPLLTFLVGGFFSVRLGVSADRTGVNATGEDVVAAVDDTAVDRLGVLIGFGNGGRSFFCLVTSPMTKSKKKFVSNEPLTQIHFFSRHLLSIEMSAMQLTDIPVLAMLFGRVLRAELPVRRYVTPATEVDVDIALPGRDALPGVASPDREPFRIGEKRFFLVFCFHVKAEMGLR